MTDHTIAEGICDLLQAKRDCPRCDHDGCGWCDECSPDVPEWTL